MQLVQLVFGPHDSRRIIYLIHPMYIIYPINTIHPTACLGEESIKKRPLFVVFDYEGVRTPPPFVVTWESEIFGPYFNVVVDAIGPETDFTLETNVKE